MAGLISPEFNIKIDKFNGGTATLINPARLPTRFAVESVNLIQDQDGIWRTRWGVDYFGNSINSSSSSIDGATEFVKQDGTREIIAVSGGYMWKSLNGLVWDRVTKSDSSYITFTEGKQCFFIQINKNLYISNGQETLTYYDGTYAYRYDQINPPTNLSATRGSGLSSGSFNNYYTVVAVNDVGNTTPVTPSINITTNKDRDYWEGSASNEFITLTWTASSGATGYQVYHGTTEGFENYIGSTSSTTFIDYGQATTPKNKWVETPEDNTTGGPKFTSMEVSSNILWGTGSKDAPYRVFWSGASQYLGKFSPFYGGGYVDIEYGGKNKPISVVHFRTGKGDPITTVLASSDDGKGATYQIELVTTPVGGSTIIVPAVYKIVGSVGTDAPASVVKVIDNIFYANKRGIYSLKNKEQMFNVLSTDNLIQPIRDQWEGINLKSFKKITAYFRNPYVLFSVPSGDENDRTCIFDTERNNWNWAWNIGFKSFFEFTDQNGKTRLLAVPNSGSRLVEISENLQGDFGVPFYQSYLSPLIPIDKDPRVLAKIKEVIFELGRFSGSVTIEVIGYTKQGITSTLTTKSISTQAGTSGWGEFLFSSFLFSDQNYSNPEIFTYDTIKKRLKVNKKVYAIQFKIYTTNKANFQLLSISANGFLIRKKSPSTWN